MKIIDRNILTKLSVEAQKSVRLRKIQNYHGLLTDPLQRMLNAFEPYSYVQPHRHQNPNKREVFIVLTGRLLVIVFNDEGCIINHQILDAEKGIYVAEIESHEWHMVMALCSGTVVYEIKDGPYYPLNDKNFASWAPDENDSNASKYLIEILEQLSIKIDSELDRNRS